MLLTLGKQPIPTFPSLVFTKIDSTRDSRAILEMVEGEMGETQNWRKTQKAVNVWHEGITKKLINKYIFFLIYLHRVALGTRT